MLAGPFKQTGVGEKQVETNPSNICIYPTDIHILSPHGTMLMAFADIHTDVAGCLIAWFPPTHWRVHQVVYSHFDFAKLKIRLNLGWSSSIQQICRILIEKMLASKSGWKLGSGKQFKITFPIAHQIPDRILQIVKSDRIAICLYSLATNLNTDKPIDI